MAQGTPIHTSFRRPTPRLLAAALLLAVAGLYVAAAAGRMVLDVDEALYIAAGRAMARTGDLVTPYVDGLRFLDKPPLLYWVLAGLFRLLGPSELAAHLPPVLAVLATTALLAWIGARGGGSLAGVAAGGSFAFSVGTFLFTRETLPDSLLIACITLAMAAAVAFRLGRLGGAAAACVFGAAVAGAVLSKGLIGVLFPLATLALVRLVEPEPRRVRLRDAALALATFAALALPWHVVAARRNPGFFQHVIVNEQLLRFLGQREPADVVSTPLLVFWAMFLVWLLPWTPFLPAALVMARQQLRGTDARGVVARLALGWAVVVVVFFSVSARLDHYAFGALPPLALLIGLALAPEPRPAPSRALRRGFVAGSWLGAALLAVAVVAALVVVVWGPGVLGSAAARPDRAYDSDYGPLAAFPRALREQLLPLAAIALGAGGLAFLLARRFDASGRRAAAVTALCGSGFVFGLMADRALRAAADEISSRPFGVALARHAAPSDRFFVLGDFETANSILFYAPQRIELVDGQAPTLAYGLSLPDARPLTVSTDELAAAWRGASRVFLLADRARLPSLGLPHPRVIAESADRVLVSNEIGASR